jgi:hypothetical protein
MCHKVGKMIRNDYGLVQAWEEAVVAFLKYWLEFDWRFFRKPWRFPATIAAFLDRIQAR